MITYNTIRKIAQQPMMPNAAVNNDDKNSNVNPIYSAHYNWMKYNSQYSQLDDVNDPLKKSGIFRLRIGKDQENLQRQQDTAQRNKLMAYKNVRKTQADLNNHVDNTFGGSITKPDPNSGYYGGVKDYMAYVKKLRIPASKKNWILYGNGTKANPQGGVYGYLSQPGVNPNNVKFYQHNGFGRLSDGTNDFFIYEGERGGAGEQAVQRWLAQNRQQPVAAR